MQLFKVKVKTSTFTKTTLLYFSYWLKLHMPYIKYMIQRGSQNNVIIKQL